MKIPIKSIKLTKKFEIWVLVNDTSVGLSRLHNLYISNSYRGIYWHTNGQAFDSEYGYRMPEFDIKQRLLMI